MNTHAHIGSGHARTPALALLAVFFVALVAVAVLPHLWSLDLAHRITSQTITAERYEADARNLKASQQRLAALSDPKIANSMLLGGNSAGLNGADLQKQVSELAATTGIALQSLRIADPEKWEHGLRNIRLDIGMRASLAQLQGFLFEIETRRPVLFVEALTVATATGMDSAPDDAPLDVSLIIRGLALDGSPADLGPRTGDQGRTE